MAAFTELDAEAQAELCEQWQLGQLRGIRATDSGIENSNFFVSSEIAGRRHEWVLTLGSEPFAATTLDTLLRLDAAGLPVPVPLRDRAGALTGSIAGAPALLTPCFPGSHPEQPTLGQIRAIGRFLARMHQITANLPGPDHPRNAAWIAERSQHHRALLGARGRERLDRASRTLASVSRRRDWCALPSGVVHGDVFRDNVLFEGERLSAVIDFHHSARAPLLFDLAVVANDCCSNAAGYCEADRLRALLDGYQRIRPLTREERWLWPAMTVLAALRFWLARLDNPRKPPAEMARRLDAALAQGFPLSGPEARTPRTTPAHP